MTVLPYAIAGLLRTSVTLLANANGDVLRETFQLTLYGCRGWVSRAGAQVFMYAFTVLFIYVLLRTTLAVNEQAYLAVRPPIVGGPTSPLAKPTSPAVAFRLPWRIRKLLQVIDDSNRERFAGQ